MGHLRIFFILLVISLGFWIFLQNADTPFQQFTEQAQSFINGRLDVSILYDTVYKEGKYYWPQGPFPSIILVPFIWISGSVFNQTILQFLLISLMAFLSFRLAKISGYERSSAAYLVFALLFASTCVGIIVDPRGWFYAQVVTLTLLTGLLLEYETRRRPLMLGFLTGTILATRPTAALIAVLVLIKFIRQKSSHLMIFLTPIIISIIFLGVFNYIRFGHPLDNGYTNNNVGEIMKPLRQVGLFNLEHLPSNIYYYFLASVQPVMENNHLIFPYYTYSPWGLSFLLISPFFLLALKSLKTGNKSIKWLWGITGFTLFILLIYYAPGVVQFGPRYTADFMPILYLITLKTLKPPHLTNMQKNIIILSATFNIYLLLSYFYVTF